LSLYLASLRAVNCSSGKCNILAATDHNEFITLVAGKRPSLLMAGNNDEFYDEKLNITPKTTLCSGKPESSVTVRKDSARVIISLRLTTDGHKASRGFCATAELLVGKRYYVTMLRSPYDMSRPSVICLSSVTLLHATHRVEFFRLIIENMVTCCCCCC